MGDLVERAWGSYEILTEGHRYKVKRLVMMPGEQFSYQYHHHRAELWAVVRGTIQFKHHDGREELIPEGGYVAIPALANHKMTNPGRIPAIVIEVQYGSYLEEDDIVRLD